MASEIPAHRASLTNSSTQKARTYIQNKEVPQLFEALMTGLMFKQPDDHYGYIIESLQKIKDSKTPVPIKWNTFIGDPAPTELSPIVKNESNSLNKDARILSGN
jgi:hypothetical protein